MKTVCKVALAVAALGVGGWALAAELVGVQGSGVQLPTAVETMVGERPVKLVLTGAAVRTKYFVNVYVVGSYLQEGVHVGGPEELAGVNAVKRLQLVLERDVSGDDMADAFQAAIRANYAEPAFNAEVAQLTELMKTLNVKKGDHVWLTHLPGVGLHVRVVGKADVTIKNPQFSRAIWDVYLGPRNLGADIKKGLTGRL